MQPEKEIEPSKEINSSPANAQGIAEEGLRAQKPELINVVKQPDADSNDSSVPKIFSPDELDTADRRANALIAEEEVKAMTKDGIKVTNDIPYSHVSTSDFANGGIPGRKQTIIKWVFILLFAIYLAFTILHRAKT